MKGLSVESFRRQLDYIQIRHTPIAAEDRITLHVLFLIEAWRFQNTNRGG
jgi:hypothetical protein